MFSIKLYLHLIIKLWKSVTERIYLQLEIETLNIDSETHTLIFQTLVQKPIRPWVNLSLYR